MGLPSRRGDVVSDALVRFVERAGSWSRGASSASSSSGRRVRIARLMRSGTVAGCDELACRCASNPEKKALGWARILRSAVFIRAAMTLCKHSAEAPTMSLPVLGPTRRVSAPRWYCRGRR